MSLSKKNQGGFGLIESIIVIVLAVVIVFAIYHFGWGARESAGETALQAHVDIMQKAVDLYMFDSRGRYPTEDGKLPADGQYKLIMWDASFTYSGQELVFYPNYTKRKPQYWDEPVWRLDSNGKVSAIIDPKGY